MVKSYCNIYLQELTGMLTDYIQYMGQHNQTEDSDQLLQSALENKRFYYSLIRSMLGHMAKFGYPDQFPEDGSVFRDKLQSNFFLPNNNWHFLQFLRNHMSFSEMSLVLNKFGSSFHLVWLCK